MKKKWFIWICIGILCGMVVDREQKSYAKVIVRNYHELKQVLNDSGEQLVELGANIVISDTILIRGSKTIVGKGYRLERNRSGEKVYGGTLFLMLGKKCEWKQVIVSGNSNVKHVKGKVFGKLLEMRSGKTVIGKGSVWRNNKNRTLAVDGGGALLIRGGARCDLEGGVICDNVNVSCGAGIRVDPGGELYMKQGEITENQSHGIAKQSGFDGLGGAIYNEGKLVITGGVIKKNQVRAYIEENVKYGGTGGGIYNKGSCVIGNATIKENGASQYGDDVYSEESAEIKIQGGILKENRKPKSHFSSPRQPVEKKRNEKQLLAKRNGKEGEDRNKEWKGKDEDKKEKKGKSATVVKNRLQKERIKQTVTEKKKDMVHNNQGIIIKKQDKKVEEWYFSCKKICEIKKFMDGREDPFSKQTNDLFLSMFEDCKQGEGEQ